MVDFIVAVGAGIVLNANDPTSMANVQLMPIAIIPLVGVPLSGAAHIAALHMLKTGKAKIGETQSPQPINRPYSC